MEFDVGRIRLGRRREILAGVGKALGSVTTKAEKSRCLHAVRIRNRGLMERADGSLEMSLLELGQAQIHLHTLELGI